MSTWSCSYQVNDYQCKRMKKTCEPGMKGCTLRGKVRFAKDESDFPGESIAPSAGKRKAKIRSTVRRNSSGRSRS